MSGGKVGHVGGVEWQTSLTARWLAQRGHDVSMITVTEGPPHDEIFDGVRVIKTCREDVGFRGLRFFAKWISLNRALRQANADVYYHNCGDCFTGQVAIWCKLHKRAFVFSAASEPDCDRTSKKLKTSVERALFHYGLKRATYRIVQTNRQKLMLEQGFKLTSEAIPMPCPAPTLPVPDRSAGTGRARRILWLARICRQKRPDRLLELARRNPDLEFDLVGPVANDDYARATDLAARSIPNIRVHGKIPKDQVARFYADAHLFLSTSDYEGFPNTFLEAWSYGLPIVSTFDPDGLITSRGLGVFVNSLESMENAINRLMNDTARYVKMAAAAREYFGVHSVDTVLPQFESVFSSLCTPRVHVRRS